MTEATPVANPMEMVVTTNSAPVEQKSTEMVTTEPKTILESVAQESIETAEPIEKPEVIKEPTAEDKANEAARESIKDRLRAENAERQLKELAPKNNVPDKKPDINDKETWGEKYKDAPNDLDTFLQARDEWAQSQGEKKLREEMSRQSEIQRNEKARIDVVAKEQTSRAKHTDYDSVINPIVPVIASIPLLKDFIAKNPMGTEVAYELGRNPAVLEQLMRSDAWTAGEQLLNMAARLKAPKPVEISNAPEPIKPVGSRETIKPRLGELASKDINGYIAMRNKQELTKRRAN